MPPIYFNWDKSIFTCTQQSVVVHLDFGIEIVSRILFELSFVLLVFIFVLSKFATADELTCQFVFCNIILFFQSFIIK